MRTTLYPGSFDPITYGHMDVSSTGKGDGYYVYNNYIYQCYDCGITFQSTCLPLASRASLLAV